jgi:hypothetical protein
MVTGIFGLYFHYNFAWNALKLEKDSSSESLGQDTGSQGYVLP